MGYDDLSDEARELSLYIENEAALYPQVRSIYKMLRDKKARGTYSLSLAPKAFKMLIERGAKKYGKEYGTGEREGLRIFNTKVRAEVAKLWAQSFEADPEGA